MTGEIAIGLMSGTSADGVTAAAGFFKDHSFKLLGWISHPYPEGVPSKIRLGPNLTAADVSVLHVEVGEIFAQAALKLMKKLHLSADKVVCVGSHGQTVYHGSRDRLKNTLQIADPATIAERTGITVVSNFRERDIAAGGEGAPLLPFFDQYFFGQGLPRAFLNIGGIANVSVVGKEIKSPLGFDTGPGNCLMDRAVRIITGGRENFDDKGQRAKKGRFDMPALTRMMGHPYFQRPPPKSTGPELFGDAFLAEHLGEKIESRPDDVLATLNYFTCLTIQEAFRRHIFPQQQVKEIVVSGGGVYNHTLWKKLECLFAPIPVVSMEKKGLPSQAKEPLAFAFFGLRCMHHQINHLPSGTGAHGARVLGSITRV